MEVWRNSSNFSEARASGSSIPDQRDQQLVPGLELVKGLAVIRLQLVAPGVKVDAVAVEYALDRLVLQQDVGYDRRVHIGLEVLT